MLALLLIFFLIFFYKIMHFPFNCVFFLSLNQMLSRFKNHENESSMNTLTHCTKNNFPSFDENIFAMDYKEWEDDDVEEFTRLVEWFEHA